LELRSRGHEVLVLAPARRRTKEENGVAIVGRAVAIPYQGTVAPIAPHWSFAAHRALGSFRPDVMHAHEPLIPSTSAVATLQSKAPVVATFHAHAERSTLFDIAAPLLRPIWRKLVVRVAVSEAARTFLTSRLKGDVRVIPNGVNVGLFRDAKSASDLPEGKRLAWVGRLDRQKGFPARV
jgi:phosphatidylinositol alpha-mannosyltransferase